MHLYIFTVSFCNSLPSIRYLASLNGNSILFRSIDYFIAMVSDIAVGAYLSDKGFLMFGQSVINMEITIETSVRQIDPTTGITCVSPGDTTSMPCFTVKVCFYYNYRLPFIGKIKNYLSFTNYFPWIYRVVI